MPVLTISSMFSDHMIVQRGRPLPVWGMASAGATVEVRCSGQTRTTNANRDGKWRVEMEALPEDVPQTIDVISAGEKIQFVDVLVGDVFLCSGQSNMQWPLFQVSEVERAKGLAALGDGIRLYQFPKEGKSEPVAAADARWTLASEEKALEFSALALFFAEELRSHSRVPIGLIDSSYGGTVVEAWMSAEVLEARFSGEELRDSLFGWKPSSMYNAMIAPVIPFPMRAVLWYQGESNAGFPDQYRRLLPAMMDDWRRRWANESLPFFIVQLPSHFEVFDGKHFTWLREVQADVAHADPNAHLVVTYDTSDGYDLHPKEKWEISRRIALKARRVLYGEDIIADGPLFKSLRENGESIEVLIESAAAPLRVPAGEPIRGFAVACADRVFRYAEATFTSDGVSLAKPNVDGPFAVRYAWEGNTDANVYNSAGLPLAPFRTDDFPPEDVELEVLPPPHFIALGDVETLIGGDGCLRSLRIAGREFLAFHPPGFRGGAFHTMWGPTRLFHVRKDGPASLIAENETGRVHYQFSSKRIALSLKNNGREDVLYWLPFANGVSEPIEESGVVRVVAGNVAVSIRGVRIRTEPDMDRPIAEILLKSGDTATITIIPMSLETVSPELKKEQSSSEI